MGRVSVAFGELGRGIGIRTNMGTCMGGRGF